MISRHLIGFLFVLCLPVTALLSAEPQSKTDSDQHKIVLIAGPKSHGPVGNGIHDYPWSVKLLKVMLDNSNIRDKVKVEYHLEGWPENGFQMENALSRDEGLKGMTIWAAKASFEEDLKGSIEAGKFADFVVMGVDLMNVDISAIPEAKVVSTYTAGEKVY